MAKIASNSIFRKCSWCLSKIYWWRSM